MCVDVNVRWCHRLTQQEFDMPAMIKYFEEGGAEVMETTRAGINSDSYRVRNCWSAITPVT